MTAITMIPSPRKSSSTEDPSKSPAIGPSNLNVSPRKPVHADSLEVNPSESQNLPPLDVCSPAHPAPQLPIGATGSFEINLTPPSTAGGTRGWDPNDDPAHNFSDISRQGFFCFVEGLSLDDFHIRPIEESIGLTFEEVPLRVGGTQTLSIEEDRHWRVKQRRDGGRRVLLELVNAMLSGMPSRELGDTEPKTKTEFPSETENERVVLESVNQEGSGYVLAEETPSIPSSPHHDSNSQRGRKNFPLDVPILYSKCSTRMDSLPRTLLRVLPFIDSDELSDFFQSSTPTEIGNLIELVRDRHLESFGSRLGHVLENIPPASHDCPSPPKVVTELNFCRLRYKNINYFLHQLDKEAQMYLPVESEDYDFLWKELFDIEDEAKQLVSRWNDFISAYLAEYDQLISWLRLREPLDTSKAETEQDVKRILDYRLSRIVHTRRQDIREAIVTFSRWADKQYESMRMMEVSWREKVFKEKQEKGLPGPRKRRWNEVGGQDVHPEAEVDDSLVGQQESREHKRRRGGP